MTAEAEQRVLIVANPSNAEARAILPSVIEALTLGGAMVRLTEEDCAELNDLALGERVEVVPSDEHAADGAELVIVLGGDGTVLRAVERSRACGAPLLGVNLGHVGFLAEAEPEDLHAVVTAIVARRWLVEERLTLDVRLVSNGEIMQSTWALNELAIERRLRDRMIEILVEVDGRPLSRWGCDGVLCATPTGSTAYAFSAGGPVVWPEVAAMLVVPLSAHALFARPLVVSPTSVVALELGDLSEAFGSADGRRLFDVPAGGRIEVRRHEQPVRFARLVSSPFTDRLVAKFQLPVHGWRGRRHDAG